MHTFIFFISVVFVLVIILEFIGYFTVSLNKAASITWEMLKYDFEVVCLWYGYVCSAYFVI